MHEFWVSTNLNGCQACELPDLEVPRRFGDPAAQGDRGGAMAIGQPYLSPRPFVPSQGPARTGVLAVSPLIVTDGIGEGCHSSRPGALGATATRLSLRAAANLSASASGSMNSLISMRTIPSSRARRMRRDTVAVDRCIWRAMSL